MDKVEYLELARKNEDLIINAIKTFHPYFRTHFPDVITAQSAELACSIARSEIKSTTNKNPIDKFLSYNTNDVMSIANEVWFGMPESMESRNHPAFFLICDLAEGYDYV